MNPLSPSKKQLKILLGHFQNRRFIKAEILAKSLTKEFPSHKFAWKILGAVFNQTGRINEAIIFMHKSIQLDPQDAEAHNNLGVIYQDLGRLEEAEASYTQATILQENYIEAYCNLGNILKDQGKLEKAVNAHQKAISINPNYSDAYYNMGITLKLLGKLEESKVCYTKAIELNPNHSKAYNNLGNILQEKGKIEEAIIVYKKALLINPNYVEAYNNMGNVFKDQGKLEESIKLFKKTLSINPNYAYAYNNIGNALKEQGKLEESVKSFKKALSIKPDFALALNNMGVALKDQGKTKEAIQAFKKALSINFEDSVTHKNLSFTLLNFGRFKEGLDEYEWRWKTNEFITQYRYFSQPLWNKKIPLNGKSIFLWCEQGVGDTITWSSCISHITVQAKHCILECQEKLVPLLKRSYPNIEVKAEDRSLDTSRNDFDFHIPMGSLYKNLNTEIFQKTKVDPYLIPDQARVEYWKKKLISIGKGPYIGVSWKSVVMSPDRIPNYASIYDWFPLFRLPNIKFINLQPKDFEEDLNKIKNELGITVYNFEDIDHWNDLDDVAALCTALDMVVSNKITVPLISAGVGTLTKLANWKQSAWNNILLNPRGPLVDIYEKDTCQSWDNVFNSIAKDILKFKNKKEANG